MRVCGEECGSHPSCVVEYALKLKKARESEERGSRNRYSVVWCVFDRDAHPKIHEAVDRAKALKFKMAYSNPCFELWFLLHFRYSSAHIERDKAQSELTKLLQGYEKSVCVYERLLELQAQAIANAEKLRSDHETGGGLTAESNPYTTADRLVVFLNSLETRAPR